MGDATTTVLVVPALAVVPALMVMPALAVVPALLMMVLGAVAVVLSFAAVRHLPCAAKVRCGSPRWARRIRRTGAVRRC